MGLPLHNTRWLELPVSWSEVRRLVTNEHIRPSLGTKTP